MKSNASPTGPIYAIDVHKDQNETIQPVQLLKFVFERHWQTDPGWRRALIHF